MGAPLFVFLNGKYSVDLAGLFLQTSCPHNSLEIQFCTSNLFHTNAIQGWHRTFINEKKAWIKRIVLKLGLRCTTLQQFIRKVWTQYVPTTSTKMLLKWFPIFFLDIVTSVTIWCQTTVKHMLPKEWFRIRNEVRSFFCWEQNKARAAKSNSGYERQLVVEIIRQTKTALHSWPKG